MGIDKSGFHSDNRSYASTAVECSQSSQERLAEILASVSAYLQIVAGNLLEKDPLLAGRIKASDLVQEPFAAILSDPNFGDLPRSHQFDGFDLEKPFAPITLMLPWQHSLKCRL